VATDLVYLTEVLGGRVVFAVEAMGTRVAAVQLEIPQGPCCSFQTPGGHRIALYQLTRPEVLAHFNGRRDF
jgi:hypothetical protein